jgi:Protein of unknown function (DUF2971)
MNDPVENKDLGLMGFDFQRLEVPDPERWMRELQERVTASRDRVRLASFTGDETELAGPDLTFGSCFVRPRMWEQYGERHSGICLVFDRAMLESRIETELAEVPHYSGDVRYTPGGWAQSNARTAADADMLDRGFQEVVIQAHIDTYKDDFFFLKMDDWAAEHEYRLVLLDRSEEYGSFSYGESLHSVVLGERFPDWMWPAAKSATEEAGLQLLQLGWHDGRPFVMGTET